MSLEPAALRLGVPKTYLRKLADAGDVPYIDTGGRRLFCLTDVAEALRAKARQSRRAL